jgi:hypothetical protein
VRVAGLGGSREQHQPARVAVDAVHHVQGRARFVAQVIADQVEERHLFPAAPGQRFDDHAGQFVGDDERPVFGGDPEPVPLVVRRPVGGPGRARAVHPEGDAQAWRQAVRRLVRTGGPAVEVHLAPLEPRRGAAARPRAGVARQPEVEPHPGGVSGDDPLLHPVVSW